MRDLGFVSYDDGTYVVNNDHVNGGLSLAGVRWAFTSAEYACNWHPLTWISHMLDVSLFASNAGAHHVHSVLLHALSAALLFLALRSMTGAVWRSALVAALFAWHPLRVESVAWIAERKDVLSGVYWMATIWCYARWVRAPGAVRYGLLIVVFACGLMSKPMLVTLPCVLLLCDRWPLRRSDSVVRLVVEKLPLFALAAGSALITLSAQEAGGCTSFIEEGVATGSRAANAAVAYAQYLAHTFWPVDLAVFYPHPAVLAPDESRLAATVAASALLAAVTAGAWMLRRRVPAVLFGWLWFLGTLVPVVGVVQVGGQALADRYAYLPLIGIYVALAWTAGALARHRPALRVPIVGAALLSLGACAWVTARQIPVWQNTVSLFGHALDVTEHNYVAHTALGRVEGEAGRLDAAKTHFQAASDAAPRYYEAALNLGWTAMLDGDPAQALPHLERAVAIRPSEDDAHFKLGRALHQLGRLEEARASYNEAIRRDSESFDPHLPLAFLLARDGDLAGAVEQLTEARRIRPEDGEVRVQLGHFLLQLNRLDEAEAEFEEARMLVPDHAGLDRAWLQLQELRGRDQ